MVGKGFENIENGSDCGENIEAVLMLPDYTHNIINLSQAEKLVTVMWANESYDPNKPDTFGEKVVILENT